MFALPEATVILNEDQGHWNWYMVSNIEFNYVYYHTKLERNQSLNI